MKEGTGWGPLQFTLLGSADDHFCFDFPFFSIVLVGYWNW